MGYLDPLPDHYHTLGIRHDATPREIVAAYRREVRLSHPDLHPADPVEDARIREVNRAYEVLGDPGRRAEYDRELAHREGPPTWRARPSARRASVRVTWSAQPGPAYVRRPPPPPLQPVDPFTLADDLLDLFDALFGDALFGDEGLTRAAPIDLGWGRTTFRWSRGPREAEWGFPPSRRRPFGPF